MKNADSRVTNLTRRTTPLFLRVAFVSPAKLVIFSAVRGPKTDFLKPRQASPPFTHSVKRGSFLSTRRAALLLIKIRRPSKLFTLGGARRLSAYRRNEFSGSHYILKRAGYLREIYTLPSLLGGEVYAFGAVESGGAFHHFRRSNYHIGVTGGVIVVTSLGPVTLGTSFGEGGRGKLYFSLGRVF